jgi:mono/diheme cytochrome c family protein
LKARNLLAIAVILIVVIVGSVALLPSAGRWYMNLAEPLTPKAQIGTTVWTPPPGALGTTIDGPPEPPMPRNIAATTLTNPTPSTPASVEKGKRLYVSYCAPCHGPKGEGDGPIAGKLMIPLPDLPANLKSRTDGYIYATIRNGGVVMPPQGVRILPAERWDIVNYLRTIQAP